MTSFGADDDDGGVQLTTALSVDLPPTAPALPPPPPTSPPMPAVLGSADSRDPAADTTAAAAASAVSLGSDLIGFVLPYCSS